MNPLKWLQRIFTIDGEELKAKCGLDGYFFLRFLRAIAFIFLPLMVLILPILLPINYIGGKGSQPYLINGHNHTAGIKGLGKFRVVPLRLCYAWKLTVERLARMAKHQTESYRSLLGSAGLCSHCHLVDLLPHLSRENSFHSNPTGISYLSGTSTQGIGENSAHHKHSERLPKQ